MVNAAGAFTFKESQESVKRKRVNKLGDGPLHTRWIDEEPQGASSVGPFKIFTWFEDGAAAKMTAQSSGLRISRSRWKHIFYV